MKVITEVVSFPESVSVRELFGKELMAVTRATGAKWEYNAADRTIKIKGSQKSIDESIKAMNKRLGLHIANNASARGSADSTDAKRPDLFRLRSLSSTTSSVGLQGLSREVAEEHASTPSARHHTGSEKVRNVPLSGDITSRQPQSANSARPSTQSASHASHLNDAPHTYFVLESSFVGVDDSLSFLPPNDSDDLPYVELLKVDKTKQSSNDDDIIPAQPLGIFNHESKSLIVLKTFMMLAAGKAFFKSKIALRISMGQQLFVRSRHHPLPSSDERLSLSRLRSIPESHVRSVFNDKISKTIALRVEKFLTTLLGFRACGERSEVRARVIDQNDDTFYDVIFDMDASTPGTHLAPVKVSRVPKILDHVTYLSATRKILDFRVQISAREIVTDPKRTSRSPDAGTTEPTPDAKTHSELFDFLNRFTWRIRKTDGSGRSPSGASSSTGIELVYPIDDTMFTVESYQKLRKRAFQGMYGNLYGSSQKKPISSPATLQENEFRIKIIRVDRSDGGRSFKITGSGVSLNKGILLGKPQFSQLETCIDFMKQLTEGSRDIIDSLSGSQSRGALLRPPT